MAIIAHVIGDRIDGRIVNPDIHRLHATWTHAAAGGGRATSAQCRPEAFPWLAEHLLAGTPRPDGGLTPAYVGAALIDDADALTDVLADGWPRCLEEGRPVYLVHHAIRPGGVQTWERLMLPIVDDAGDDHVLSYARPLAVQPEFMDALLFASMEGVLRLHALRDETGRITDFVYVLVNPAAARIFGRPSAQLIGHAMLELDEALERNTLFDHLVRVAQTRVPQRFEVTHALAGTEGHFLVSAVAIADGLAVTFADVTEIRRQSEEVRRTNARLDREVKRRALIERELRRLVDHDPMTGLLNRRAFGKAAADELARSRRYGHPLAAIMVDIDHFKRINDTYGHATGDEAIRAVGRVCGNCVRTEDRIGRMGGEEFCILLPETDRAGALRLAERVRHAVGQIRIDGKDTKFGFTASLGVASLGGEIETVDQLLDSADQALYRAKNGGRNRVVVHTSTHAAA